MDFQQVLVSSAVSGLLVGSLCTPFDVVKNYWQFNPACASNRADLSAWSVVRLLYRQQGLSGFWRGLVPAYGTIIPANVTFFIAYERRSPDEAPAWAGIKARAAAVLVTAPMELARTTMQASLGYPEDRATLRQVLSQAVKLGGIFSLWKGVLPTLIRDLPFSAIYWQSTEYMKALNERFIGGTELRSKRLRGGWSQPARSNLYGGTADEERKAVSSGRILPNRAENASVSVAAGPSPAKAAADSFVSSSLYQSFIFPFFSGALASAVACIVTHPFDVIKTNIQAGSHQIDPELRRMGYLQLLSRGVVDISRSIYGQQGLKGFSVGLTPRLLKIVPSCAVLLASYEVTKYLCGQSLLDSM
ncbi:mitochondrial carrier superfamily protein [Cystoisospora suis]|uniref:Mitochondrial carrier superfamily protein n=1 Tax=Cystoisospora suis TaxID=483139 RepID=A0A2C6KF55_9APIC|nr:mitochondrial carrier superfamily protein [Cystoisospora suis]